MAYSPSPHAAALPNMTSGTFNPRYRLNRFSPSPPQQNVNKRDKKRMAMTERLTEISSNFAENRDALYRERLRSYQADITFINTAQLYENKPLDEVESLEHLNANPVASTQGNLRTSQLQPNGNSGAPNPISLGKHAVLFAQEVNDALERKDASLVEVAVSQKLPVI